MKKQLLRFTLSAIIIYLTSSTFNLAVAASQPSAGNVTLFCGVIDDQWNKRYSDQYPNRRYARSFAANLNVGEPRTIRMVYLLPNDRPYRAEVVQRMKDEILKIQTFFAEQMGCARLRGSSLPHRNRRPRRTDGASRGRATPR